MSEFNTLLVDRVGTDGRVAQITLNTPKKANALSDEMFAELNDCLHALEADHEARVIILRGAGRGFSGGYDLTEAESDHPRAHRPKNHDEQGRVLMANMRVWLQQESDVLLYFWNMQKVTIAQLHGFALAGGCELAMMADLVVASHDADDGVRLRVRTPVQRERPEGRHRLARPSLRREELLAGC